MFWTTRTFYLIVFVLFASFKVYAQDPRVADSLCKDLVEYGKKDTIYLDKMQDLQKALLFARPDTSIKLSRQSQQIADSLGDIWRLARATNMTANAYKLMGMFDLTLKSYIEALKLFEKTGDQKWIANMHSNIGAMHYTDGNYEQALNEQEIALEIRRKIGYYTGISGIYNTFGNVYCAQKNYLQGLHYYELALDSTAPGDVFSQAMYLGNIGNTYGLLGQHATCREMNLEALAIHTELGLPYEMSRDLHNVGEAFLLEGQLDSAIAYNLKAHALGTKGGYFDVIAAACSSLKSAYSKQGNYRSAFDWTEKALVANDTLNSRQISAESRTLELTYRMEKEEQEAKFKQEADLMQKDEAIRRQEILLISLIVGLVLAAGFGIVLYKRNQEKQAINALLETKVSERTQALSEANHQLSYEIEEKEQARQLLSTFVYRSSHDLKGPLTSMKGLVNVAQSEPGASPYIQMIGIKAEQLDGVLQQLIDKVEVDARSPVPQAIDFKALWNELHAELSQRKGYPEIQFQLQDHTIGHVEADPMLIKLALRQLMQNAIDFRVKGSPENRCVVTVSGQGNHWNIAVEDNGIGFEQGQLEIAFEMFARGSNQSVGAGLGLYIVKEIAKKLNSNAEATQRPEGGTRFFMSV